MSSMLSIAKQLGKNHDLAIALWDTGWYEARMLASLVDDPQHVTRQQMNAWAADWDSWAIVDTVCFKLFDQVPFAWDKAPQWAASPREFVRRGGFVLMACLAAHDADSRDSKFLPYLPIIEEGAQDDRNFVKKGVNWALRQIGHRNLPLNAAALKVAKRLALSTEPAPRWVGKDAVRELTGPKVRARLADRA